MSCKICNSNCDTIYDFGSQYLANDYKYHPIWTKAIKENLKIVKCTKCNTIQLDKFVDPHILYNQDYCYKTYVNQPFRNHLKQLANYIQKNYNPTEKNVLLDIGSNDGTFISFFKDKYSAVGVDPSAIYDPNLQQFCRFFNSEFAKEFLSEYKKPSVITALNVLAHVPDIHQFLDSVISLMNKKTVLIIEVQHNKQICQGIFDQIYHEHCYYFDCYTLTSLLNSHGIKVNSYQIFTELNGGTLRVECTLGKQTKSLPLDPYNKVAVHKIYDNIRYSINSISSIVSHIITSNNLRLFGYGAPAKAALMINQIPELQDIHYTLDVTNDKFEKYIPGTNVLIKDARTNLYNVMNSGEQCAIFMFSWNYFYHIMKQNNNFQDNYIIVPFPSQNVYLCPTSSIRKVI